MSSVYITTFQIFSSLLVFSETGLPPKSAGNCRLLLRYLSDKIQCPRDYVASLSIEKMLSVTKSDWNLLWLVHLYNVSKKADLQSRNKSEENH